MSTNLQISTKRTINLHLKPCPSLGQARKSNRISTNHVLAWDRHEKVTGLDQMFLSYWVILKYVMTTRYIRGGKIGQLIIKF
jgi:hypothetical protein